MPESFRLNYDNLKRHTHAPIWNFTGLFIAAILAFVFVIAFAQNEKKMTGFILAPQKNDVYELNLKDDVYTLYKIKKIASDTIYFWPSKFQTDQASGLNDIADKGDKGFDESITVGFPKVKLLDMHKTGAIIAVDRKQ